MFYGQCWKCGERWELGTASTCKCPEKPEMIYPDYTLKETAGKLSIRGIKPNYNMTFHRDGKQIGALDFNGPKMTFTGDTDESAKVFFDFIAKGFEERLERERADEREACAELIESIPCECCWSEDSISIAEEFAEAIRARGQK